MLDSQFVNAQVYSTLIEERVLEVLQQCCTLVEGISVFALFTITTECVPATVRKMSTLEPRYLGFN